MKYFLGTILLFVSIMLMAQQRPFISSLSKTSGTVGETVVISGSNFAADHNDMQVNFGAGKATIVSGSDSQLEVLVPSAATYGPVLVTDLNTGRSASSTQHFTLSFGGSAFDPDKLDNQVNYATNNILTTDLCTCDFDGDGWIDAAVSNAQSSAVNIFKNDAGNPGTFIDVTGTVFNQSAGIQTVATECADLNGDGKPDLAFTADKATASPHVIIYQNTSSSSMAFSLASSFKLPTFGGLNRNPRRIRFADLDGDGKPELIVSNESDNRIHVYLNTSSLTTVSFATTPIEISGGTATNSASFVVGDLNKDNLADIIFVPFRQPNEFVYVLKNESTAGQVSFANPLVLNQVDNRTNVKLADLNNDGFPEIITAGDVGNRVAVFTNNTSSAGEDPSFTLTENIVTDNAWSIAAGDLNGDGLADLLIASTANTLFYFQNSSTEDVILEASVRIPTTSTPRNIQMADINGDAKPDLLFTHRSLNNTPGELSVIINRNCLTPTISPAGLTFCTGSANAFTLTATNAAGVSYDWTFDPPLPAGNILSRNGNEIELYVNEGTTSLEAQVTITSQDGSCTDTATETFTLTGGANPDPPNIDINQSGIICSGSPFTLSAPAGQETYLWTLPDGSTASGEELEVPAASAADAGTYRLRVQPPNGCFSPESTITVEVDEPPLVSIVNSGDDDICVGTSVTLEVPVYDGFSYQWKRNGTNTGNGQGTLEVSESGDYTVTVISDATACETESPEYTINVISKPVSSFTAVEEICTGVEMSFTATSTGEGFELNYIWDFGDGSVTVPGKDVLHAFPGPQDPNNSDTTYFVTLTTAYNDISSCSDDTTRAIIVSDPPTLTIEAAEGSFEKCPADSVRLELPEGHQSYTWSTGDTGHYTWAKTRAKEDEVEVTAEVITDLGCSVEDISPVTVSNYANSRIEIASPEAEVADDMINLESGVSTVKLTAANGSNYVWEPAELIQVTGTGGSVIVYPKDRETVITVTGTDDSGNGCETTAAVTIITPGVIARKSFSPNGDGMGFDCWEILNSDNLQGCEVYVFDQRGRYVFRGSSPFEDNCVWNGNIDNGSSPAPEGVYYFVMKCDNNDFNKTGTILLGR